MKLLAASLGVIVTCLTVSPAAAEPNPTPPKPAESYELAQKGQESTPVSQSVVTSGLSGLFRLVEEDQFQAHVVLTTTDGVRSLAVGSKQTVSEVLASDRERARDFVTEDGKPVVGERKLTNGETLLLFGSEYENKFERIELAPTLEELDTASLPEGETMVVEEGKSGQALKTVVSVTKLTKSKKPQVVTTELLTVIVPPTPRQVLVGTGEEVPAAGSVPSGPAPVELQYPVTGPVTSPFGMRVHPITGEYKLHDGTDFSASCGTPILAAGPGVVTQASYSNGYGNKVDVDHGGGFVTSYTHLSTFSVEVGDKVDHSTVLGQVGSTGYSTGCHLHFMTVQNGTPIDPMTFLE